MFAASRAPAAVAAFANGVASHILELDDVHKGSTLHGAAPIIPAALAVAEREHRDGRAFLLAVAIGLRSRAPHRRSCEPQPLPLLAPYRDRRDLRRCGRRRIPAQLNADQLRDALGSAGTQAAGLWEFNSDGSMSKHLHPGKAALNGILAADLARAGFTGASRILEGDRGFFRAMSEHHDATRITDRLGSALEDRRELLQAPFLLRPHPHRHRHGPAVARARTIAAVHIETYGPGFEIVKELHPRTPYQAKFSIAYCVAAALVDGKVGLEQFTA